MKNKIIIYNDVMDNAEELQDIIHTFDLCIDYDAILCEASLGLWYGRREAKKTFKSLYLALTTCAYDDNEIFFINHNSTLNMRSIHHDGVNNYKFYKLINNKKYAIKIKDVL